MPVIETFGPDGRSTGGVVDHGDDLNLALPWPNGRAQDIAGVSRTGHVRIGHARELHHEMTPGLGGK
jgi:hypothetical protein